MGNLLYILLALVMLGVIIFIHEFGHYLAGRLCGIGIVEFAIGMGPKIISWKRSHKIRGTQETETIRYSLRLLPLGGFCAFVGEDEENSDPRAMNNMPVWKRFATVFAGPFMNFLLAFVLSVALIATNQMPNVYEVETLPMVSGVMEDMPAAQAGFKAWDIIEALDGDAITLDGEGTEKLRATLNGLDEGQSVQVTLRRIPDLEKNYTDEALSSLTPEELSALATENVTVTLVPQKLEGRVLLGVNLPSYYERYDCNVFEAVGESFKFMANTAVETYRALIGLIGNLFTGGKIEEGTVSGVVGIVSNVSTSLRASFSDALSLGLLRMMLFIMVISLSLGIMNLLPLPALDGGRLILLIFEGITGKHVNRKVEAYINLAGLALLLGIMLVVTYFDIRTIVRK